MDTLACPGGSDHHGPQRTCTSNTHHMPGKQKGPRKTPVSRGPFTLFNIRYSTFRIRVRIVALALGSGYTQPRILHASATRETATM